MLCSFCNTVADAELVNMYLGFFLLYLLDRCMQVHDLLLLIGVTLDKVGFNVEIHGG